MPEPKIGIIAGASLVTCTIASWVCALCVHDRCWLLLLLAGTTALGWVLGWAHGVTDTLEHQDTSSLPSSTKKRVDNNKNLDLN